MRELAVRFGYEPGVDPIVGVFIDYTEPILESSDIAFEDGIVRFDSSNSTRRASVVSTR